jgi:hypothetical protein
LLKQLKVSRIHIVPQGEVECWIRTIGGKGMAWLNKVFEEMKRGNIQFSEELLGFVSSVIAMQISPATSVPAVDKMTRVKPHDQTKQLPSAAIPTTEIPRRSEVRLRGQMWLYGLIAIAIILAAIALARTL